MRSGAMKLACLVLLAATLAGSAAARSLQQFNAQPFCPDGCTDTGCIQDATKGGLRCQKCKGNLVVNKVSGNCACPAGKYATADNPDNCIDCPKGSYCPGSDYSVPKFNGDTYKPEAVPCPVSGGESMTTIGKRMTSQRACVNMPGFYYTIDTLGTTVGQVQCPINTYSAGLKKQRACVPCPTGYLTNGAVQQSSPNSCIVPAGYYLKAPGQIAPCPKGEYKAGVGLNGNCTKCAFGVTTPAEASISVDNCTILTPGYYALRMSAGIVTATVACPQSYYCPGGIPVAAFDPSVSVVPNVNDTTIKQCPDGMWTQDLASSSLNQCLTPPGFKTVGGATVKCENGSYRADWKPAGQATACVSCGDGVQAERTDVVTQYNVVTNVGAQVQITTAADDCFIQPGQGLYYNTISQSWRAKNCITNAYGVANKTFGLTPAACRDCPSNMVTALSGSNSSYSVSAQYFIDNGDGTKGFTDVRACVTVDGYGYNGRVAQMCDQGTYNAKNTYDACKPCPYGLTTEGPGKGVTNSSCGVAKGFGYTQLNPPALAPLAVFAVVPCPIGTYNAKDWTGTPNGNGTATAPCTPCSTGLTTAAEGSNAADQCSLCVGGYGGVNCSSTCGGLGAAATYGPPGRGVLTNPDCVACSNQTTGYSFEWNMQNDLFQSLPLSKPYASSSLDCVAQQSQLMDGAWYLPIAADDANAKAAVTKNSFAECAAMCTTDPCAFVTYDYVNKSCVVRDGTPPVYVGAPLIGYKNLPSGDVGTNGWKVKDKKAGAKMVATGTYTFYRDEQALKVGLSQEAPVPAILPATGYDTLAQGLQDCLNACDNEVWCAGITILMNVNELNRPTTCKLIRGQVKLGVFQRTVVRADTNRMPLPSLRDLP